MYTMLVAYDGSENAERAVRHAVEMARRLEAARIVLVNVQPPAMSGEVSNLLTAEEVMEQHLAEGRKVLSGAATLLEQAGVPFESEIAIGRPADAIVEYAQRVSADAIVIGASSHGPVRSLMLGSVVSKVAHSAPVPVTVVK